MITEKTDVLIIASDTTAMFVSKAYKGKTKASETQTNSPKILSMSSVQHLRGSSSSPPVDKPACSFIFNSKTLDQAPPPKVIQHSSHLVESNVSGTGKIHVSYIL